MISFDPSRHIYHDGETIIPSVTQVLKSAGWIDDQWYTEEARERGSAVHELCERYAKGKRIDDIGRPLANLQYVNAFAQWVRDNGAYAIETEQIVDHTLNGYRYAGKFDLLAEVRCQRVLIDLKTGGKAKWHKIQVAAYALDRNPTRASVLYLQPDGEYIEDRITAAEMLWGIERFKEALT